jgi:hypothetical protein
MSHSQNQFSRESGKVDAAHKAQPPLSPQVNVQCWGMDRPAEESHDSLPKNDAGLSPQQSPNAPGGCKSVVGAHRVRMEVRKSWAFIFSTEATPVLMSLGWDPRLNINCLCAPQGHTLLI